MDQSIHFYKKITMLTIVFFFIFYLAISNGAALISLDEVINGILSTDLTHDALIIKEVRLPRVLSAIFIGAAIGLAGSMIQGMTRNPLADPGLLGITAGASFLLTIGMIISASLTFFQLTLFAFFGALIGTVLVIGISLLSKEKLTTFTLLLVGASVSMFLFALSQGLGLYFNITKNVNMWTAGGLTAVTMDQLKVIAPFILISTLITLYYAKDITLLSLDEHLAVSLGQNVFKTKLILMILIAILTGLSVALAGNLAFVGLMIPHLVRKVVGSDYKRMIPAAFLVGGSFMMIADLIARTINKPYEVPLITVVSVIGLPFFLWIVKSQKGGHLS